MKRFLILFLFVSMIILITNSCKQTENVDVQQNENFTINSVSLNDYAVNDETVVFYTQMILTNNAKESKYISIKGDFESDYNSGLIKTRILTGVDVETGYKTFLVPGDSQILFEVSFTSKHNVANIKNDRLPPEIIIEEINENDVVGEVATNIATKSDGTIIFPNDNQETAD